MSTNREHWGTKLGFFLAVSGSAIGLGTMWMLPFVMGQNGGGAFILAFLGFTLFIGIPLFIAELVLGRSAKAGVVTAFQQGSRPSAGMLANGWLAILTTFLVAGWYAVVSGWGLNYLLMAITGAFDGDTS